MSSTAIRKRFLQQVIKNPAKQPLSAILSATPPPYPPFATDDFTPEDLGPYQYTPFDEEEKLAALKVEKELDALTEETKQMFYHKPRQLLEEAKEQKPPTFNWPFFYEKLDKDYVDRAKALEEGISRQREKSLQELEERVKETEALTERVAQEAPPLKFESEADIEAYEHFRQKTGPHPILDSLEVFGDTMFEELQALQTFAEDASVEFKKTLEELNVEGEKAAHVTIKEVMSDHPEMEEIISRKVKNDYFDIHLPESEYEKS